MRKLIRQALLPAILLLSSLAGLVATALFGCAGGSAPQPVASTSPSPSPPWVASDSMWDWWTKPDFLRSATTRGSLTYAVVTQSSGPVSLLTVRNGSLSRSVLALPLAPDDHNAGSVVAEAGRVAVFMQGRAALPPLDESRLYWVEGAEGDDLSAAPLQSTEFGAAYASANVSYPNAFVRGGKLLVVMRIQTGLGDQWGYVTADWPLVGPHPFSAPAVFYASSECTWPYFAIARSTRDPSVLVMAQGYHPISSACHTVRYGTLRGSQLTPTLETVYTPAPGESVRLFNVTDDAVAFATFTLPGTGADAVGTYHVARRDAAGAWHVSDLASAGGPFHGAGVRNYYGGMALAADGSVVLSRQDAAGDWYLERYGLNNQLIASHACGTVLCARPEVEALSEESYGYAGQLAVGYWFGTYSPTDYTQFSVSLTTLP